MAKTDGAVYTDKFSVAVPPDMKTHTETAAAARGVKPSVIVRWALQEWLDQHGPAGDPEAS